MSDDLSSKFNKSQELYGQVSGSHIELTSLAVTAQKSSANNPESQEARAKRLRRFKDIIDAANDYIEQLRKGINDMEDRFRERDGDAWREKLALKILGEDEIPQRRASESMDDYRNRLEPILIAKMLNEDGSIKTKYLNNPELSMYAEWAQKKYHYNAAQGHVQELQNPNTPLQRIAEIQETLAQNADIEETVFVDRDLEAGSVAQGQVKDIADNVEDKITTQEQDLSLKTELMKPI